MPTDLTQAAADIAAGRNSATALLDAALAHADAPANQHSFVRRFDAAARATAVAVDALHAAGAPLPRLTGLAVSVKDLFDVGSTLPRGGGMHKHAGKMTIS